MHAKKHIVVVGGGFAGLNLVTHLDKKLFDITLVDRNNYHSFPPLFYQIAAAAIEPASICFPLRGELRKYIADGCRYRMGSVVSIDTGRKQVVLDDGGVIAYDLLAICAGTTNNFFGIEGLSKKVYTLKSTPEALRLRNDFLTRMEQAAAETDPAKRRQILSFVVVGGGPTGVEIAGALGEMKRYIVPREYPGLDCSEITITLCEGSDRVLGAMSAEASAKALEYLHSLMVDVRLDSVMKGYDNSTVTLADGSALPTGMLIWTAGVTGEHFSFDGNSVAAGRGGRFAVDSFNRIVGVDDVFALGDIALMTSDPGFPTGHPQLAQVAIQSARNLARNLNRSSFTREFRYHDKGSMATVGRNRAVVDLPHAHFSGFIAWLTWMFIHLISILGIRNRMVVFINWLWSYFTYGSGFRMLFRVARKPEP